MVDNRLIVPDTDHRDIAFIVEDYIRGHELPVVIVCYIYPEMLDLVMSAIYKQGRSTSMKRCGDLVEISVI